MSWWRLWLLTLILRTYDRLPRLRPWHWYLARIAAMLLLLALLVGAVLLVVAALSGSLNTGTGVYT